MVWGDIIYKLNEVKKTLIWIDSSKTCHNLLEYHNYLFGKLISKKNSINEFIGVFLIVHNIKQKELM